MIVDKACVFRLGDNFFAFSGQDILEVTEIEKFSPVPRSSAVLMGLVASRGLIYPLFDLGLKLEQDKELLSLGKASDADEFLSDNNLPKRVKKAEVQHALVMRDGDGEVALAVDEVIGYESQVSTDETDMSLEIAAAFNLDDDSTTSESSAAYPSYYQGERFYYSGHEVRMLQLEPLLDAMAIQVV